MLALMLHLALAADVDRREVGALVFEGIPETPAELAERLRQYENVRSAELAGFVPGGGLFVTTRFGETSQLHRVAAPGAARGGWQRRGCRGEGGGRRRHGRRWRSGGGEVGS